MRSTVAAQITRKEGPGSRAERGTSASTQDASVAACALLYSFAALPHPKLANFKKQKIEGAGASHFPQSRSGLEIGPAPSAIHWAILHMAPQGWHGCHHRYCMPPGFRHLQPYANHTAWGAKRRTSCTTGGTNFAPARADLNTPLFAPPTAPGDGPCSIFTLHAGAHRRCAAHRPRRQ